MREKLLKLMDSEKLTASRLAELLGIRSSGISHIISERNKPSYDLLQKILRRFPNINPDWLLLDSEQMYRTDNPTTGASSGVPTPDGSLPFDAHEEENKIQNFGSGHNSTTQSIDVGGGENFVRGESLPHPISRRGVRRIIVLYDDNTFESYNPR